MKVRVRFAKYGILRFIGHLDMMRYFQKANRRAGIPVRYSEGFSPHQVMSFGSPLGLGLTSAGEYMDMELTRPIPSAEAVEALNHTMAEGVEVLSFLELPERCPGAMASVAGADYQVIFRDTAGEGSFDPAYWQEVLAAFQEAEAVPVRRKTKKSERLVDIKPHIHRLELILPQELSQEERERYFPEGSGGLRMRLSAGSAENIKPELVLQALEQVYEGGHRSAQVGAKAGLALAKAADGLAEAADAADAADGLAEAADGREARARLYIHRQDLLANTAGEGEPPAFVSLESFGSEIAGISGREAAGNFGREAAGNFGRKTTDNFGSEIAGTGACREERPDGEEA